MKQEEAKFHSSLTKLTPQKVNEDEKTECFVPDEGRFLSIFIAKEEKRQKLKSESVEQAWSF